MHFHNLPERIAYLILLYLHHALSPDQHEELDKWVEENDDNMQVFEKYSDVDAIVANYQMSS
jgi:hypothetical protein